MKHKKVLKKLVTLLFAFVLAFAMIGCNGGGDAGGGDADAEADVGAEVEEVEQVEEQEENQEAPGDGVVLTINHDKIGSPDFHPFFLEASDDLFAATGISLNPVGYPSTDIYTAAIRSALVTDSPPDLFTWWAGAWTEDLQRNDLLLPVTQVWDQFSDQFPAAVRDAWEVNGELYSLPWGVDYWVVFYNREIYEELGLTAPTSWDEFIANCEAIRDAGITPLNQTIVDEWPAFITFQEIAASYSVSVYNDLSHGRLSWTSPEAVEIFEIWRDMIEADFFTAPSTHFFSDMPRMFNDGQLAMIMTGTWYLQSTLLDAGVPEENVGMFVLRGMDGGQRVLMEPSPILVARNGNNIDETLRAVEYFMSPEGNTFLARHVGSFPVNNMADTSFLPPIKQALSEDIGTGSYTLSIRFWENMSTTLMLQVNGMFQEFIINPDVEHVTTEMQRLVESYFE